MGIIRLGQFFKSVYPHLLKPQNVQNYRKRVFAVDAASTIYSFLAKTVTYSRQRVNMPTDSNGNLTGHLIGLLYRALFCKEIGMETVWVFDGRPPQQKKLQLQRRRHIKEQASERVEQALEQGNYEEVVKQMQRKIYVNQRQRQDAKKLIQLMGIYVPIAGLPVIQGQSQAEAQCAWLVKNKMAEGVIGQDIDTIVFGGQLLIKNFNRSQTPIEVRRSEVIKALELTEEQFVDFCILCGCDYTAKIPNIGPVKALKLLKQHKTIENILAFIINDDKLRKRHPIPDDFNHLTTRHLFFNPKVYTITPEQMVAHPFQQKQLKEFLLIRDFNEARVDKWIGLAKQFDEKNSK